MSQPHSFPDRSPKNLLGQIQALQEALDQADAVVVGAGAGLSTSAGFSYAGERFERYFGAFRERYGFTDMYSGGFYPYDTLKAFWGFWSRNIYINRYQDPPNQVYRQLRQIVENKAYFVLTTNVDHCFQKAGFDKDRIFYTQGDYGLWQCSVPCHKTTYDNERQVREMLSAQGCALEAAGTLRITGEEELEIPEDLVPHCPVCGRPMAMNLRADDTFVEDAGWHRAAQRYQNFIGWIQGKGETPAPEHVLFLELGDAANTPGIIKYPFWRLTAQIDGALYACLNQGESYAPQEIAERAICLDGDIGEIVAQLLQRG